MMEFLVFTCALLWAFALLRRIEKLEQRIRFFEDQYARQHNQLTDRGMAGTLGRGKL